MFDETLQISDLLNSYQSFLVPLIFAQLVFLLSYLIWRIKRGK